MAHPAGRTARGARSWARGAFNTMDRSHDLGAQPARKPVPRASCSLPLSSLLECPPGLFQARLSRAAASLHLAPVEPGNVPPRCKENTAGTEHRGPAPAPKQPAPSLPPEPGALAPCLLYPTTVSCSQIAPFSTQPTQGQDVGSLGSVQNSVLASASHDQAPCARWSPRWMGRGWGREAGSLAFPSLPPLAAAAPRPPGVG